VPGRVRWGWGQLVRDPFLLTVLLTGGFLNVLGARHIARGGGVEAFTATELHPLGGLWVSSLTGLVVAATQALAHACLGVFDGPHIHSRPRIVDRDDMLAAFDAACAAVRGDGGGAGDAERGRWLRYSVAVQVLPLLRRVCVLSSLLCDCPHPEALPALPDPSRDPRDPEGPPPEALVAAVDAALARLRVPGVASLATALASVGAAHARGGLLLRWLVGNADAGGVCQTDLATAATLRTPLRFFGVHRDGPAGGPESHPVPMDEDAEPDAEPGAEPDDDGAASAVSSGDVPMPDGAVPRGPPPAAFLPLLPRAPQLVELPASFQDLFLALVDRPCELCGVRRSELALCLVCGRRMCVGERHCRSADGHGRCASHTAACGARVGVFMLLEHTRILALRGPRMCFIPSLYLDAFGEEDSNMRRGKLLRLSAQRYAQVSQLWAAMAMDHDTQILSNSHGRSLAFDGATAF